MSIRSVLPLVQLLWQLESFDGNTNNTWPSPSGNIWILPTCSAFQWQVAHIPTRRTASRSEYFFVFFNCPRTDNASHLTSLHIVEVTRVNSNNEGPGNPCSLSDAPCSEPQFRFVQTNVTARFVISKTVAPDLVSVASIQRPNHGNAELNPTAWRLRICKSPYWQTGYKRSLKPTCIPVAEAQSTW